MDSEKALLFYFYPKIVSCGKKRVAEQFGVRTAGLGRARVTKEVKNEELLSWSLFLEYV